MYSGPFVFFSRGEMRAFESADAVIAFFGNQRQALDRLSTSPIDGTRRSKQILRRLETARAGFARAEALWQDLLIKTLWHEAPADPIE